MGRKQSTIGDGELTRRGLVKGLAVAAVGAAIVSLSGCESEGEGAAVTVETPFYIPEKWDEEADVVVVGYGGAGAAAAITTAKEGLGEVLVIEVAPEGREGGNSRVSGQLILCPDSAEEAIKYQKALNGPYQVNDDVLKAWADNIVENVAWLGDFGADLQQATINSPEFPEVEGAEAVKTYLVNGELGKSNVWNTLKSVEEELGFPVLYGSRVTRLIQNPESKEIIGCVATKESGETVNVKARKAVILSCGGFENNPEMLMRYAPLATYRLGVRGTPYNRGDGIKLAMSVGADLWHMNNIVCGTWGTLVGEEGNPCITSPSWKSKDYIYIGPNAKRFSYEEKTSLNRHGKVIDGGVFADQFIPLPAWAVFGQKAFDAAPLFPKQSYSWINLFNEEAGETNDDYLSKGIIIKSDTTEDLAEKTSLDSARLAESIEEYNRYCENGVDPEFGRGQDVYGQFAGMLSSDREGVDISEETVVIENFPLEPIQPPYYAIQLWPTLANTQGGPVRGAKGEVIDTEGNPIPRLYAAGELGCLYGYMYNGGGNMSEALASGRIAARSAGAETPWDA
jgi:succinate dehydrogenase/fumarate reductase flavoprotein subunit